MRSYRGGMDGMVGPPAIIQRAEERMRPQVRRAFDRFNALRDGDLATYNLIGPPDGDPPIAYCSRSSKVEIPPPSRMDVEVDPVEREYDGGLEVDEDP